MQVKKPEEMLPLSDTIMNILVVLRNGEKHGYAIMKEIQGNTNKMLGTATLYRNIRDMLESGLIEEIDAPDGESDERRRYYKLTGFGGQVMTAEAKRLHHLSQQVLGQPTFKPTYNMSFFGDLVNAR